MQKNKWAFPWLHGGSHFVMHFGMAANMAATSLPIVQSLLALTAWRQPRLWLLFVNHLKKYFLWFTDCLTIAVLIHPWNHGGINDFSLDLFNNSIYDVIIIIYSKNMPQCTKIEYFAVESLTQVSMTCLNLYRLSEKNLRKQQLRNRRPTWVISTRQAHCVHGKLLIIGHKLGKRNSLWCRSLPVYVRARNSCCEYLLKLWKTWLALSKWYLSTFGLLITTSGRQDNQNIQNKTAWSSMQSSMHMLRAWKYISFVWFYMSL